MIMQQGREQRTEISGLTMVGLEHIDFLSQPRVKQAAQVHAQVLEILHVPVLQQAPVFLRLSKLEAHEPFAFVQRYYDEEGDYVLTTNIQDQRVDLSYRPPANSVIAALSVGVAYGNARRRLGWDSISIVMYFNPDLETAYYWERRGRKSGIAMKGRRMLPIVELGDSSIDALVTETNIARADTKGIWPAVGQVIQRLAV